MNAQPARAEGAVQLVLMLGVGSVAACASWSHVVDLAELNGQPGWLAVADAAVLETLAVSMGLDVRRRRRNGESTRLALCVLVAAVALQLAAQVAQAPLTFWGWTMAALPAVGFLLLVKVAMTRAGATPAALRKPETPKATVTPQAGATPAVVVAPEATALSPEPRLAGSTGQRSGADTPTPSSGSGEVMDDTLLATGRQVAADLDRHGARLSRASLAAGLRGQGVRVGTARAGELLATLLAERERASDEHSDQRPAHGESSQEHRDRHLSAVGARP